MKVLVSGSAGFIGAAVSERLLARGDYVVGVDNLDPYYDVDLKKARLATICDDQRFRFQKLDLADAEGMTKIFEDEKPEIVAHLAAQAGVRYSLNNPRAYIDSNVVGFLNILEGCRHGKIKHLVFASSSHPNTS